MSSLGCSQLDWVVQSIEDVVGNNERTLINADNLDLRTMDSKRSSESIYELGSTSLSEELSEGPFHSDKTLNSISWLNADLTSWSNIEFKDVLDTNVSVLTAESLLNWSVHLYFFNPLVKFDDLSILNKVSALSTWVEDSNGDTSLGIVSEHSEHLFLGWTTGVMKGVHGAWTTLNGGLESLESLLASVEAIPTVVHVGIKLVVNAGTLLGGVDWLHRSVHLVFIFTLEGQVSNHAVLASPSIPA